MKNFIVDFFKKSPACTGLVTLIIALHLTGVKDISNPLVEMSDGLLLIFLVYSAIVLVLGIALECLPQLNSEKGKKIIWAVIMTSILLLTIIAKIFV